MNDLIVQGGIPPSILPPENTTYSTSAEWYAALADIHIAHLTFQHNKAIESADDCRDKFVARYLFRQRVRQGKLLEDNHKNKESKKETFRLWIDDLRPHNILVDADLNIVGVIDWEWAYFAPESFVHDPPWWLLLSRPDYWRDTVLDFTEHFVRALGVFCRALRAEEDLASQTENGDGQGEEEKDGWSLGQHIQALNSRGDEVRLSDRMRRNWESGTFWANYAARKCYGFDPVFWEFLDERFFGENVEGGYEGRMHLLPEKVKRRMELVVERKVEERKEEKIVDWELEEARSYLADILADLD
jgi:hypothetical protein